MCKGLLAWGPTSGQSSIKITVDSYGQLVAGANREAVNRLPSLPNDQSSQTGVDQVRVKACITYLALAVHATVSIT